MTAGVEASVRWSVLRVDGGPAALLEGPVSEIQRWSAPDRPGVRLTWTDPDSPTICDVVADWRAAERDLARLIENEPEWNRVLAETIGLRTLHNRLFEARLGSRR
jgi:hypothetical protein